MTHPQVFVDTSALVALSHQGDSLHAAAASAARELASAHHVRFVTTVHVLDETLTLVRRRVHHRRAVELGSAILRSGLYDVVYPGAEATAQAFALFREYADVALSFTDCLSFVVMRALGLTHAFAFDEHFRLLGFQLVGG